MMESEQQIGTNSTPNTGRLIQVAAGAVERDGIITVPEGATGLVILANENEAMHRRALLMAQAFFLQKLATLVVDLFSSEELQLDAETGYFKENVDIMQQRIIGIGDWLNEWPETTHLALGLYGANSLGTAALIAAAERPDLFDAVVVAGVPRLEAIGERLHSIMAPTLLLAPENDQSPVYQQMLDGITANKHLERVGVPDVLVEEKDEVATLAQNAGKWFAQHLPGLP